MSRCPTLSVFWLVFFRFDSLRLRLGCSGCRFVRLISLLIQVAIFGFFDPSHGILEISDRFAKSVAELREPAGPENQ